MKNSFENMVLIVSMLLIGLAVSTSSAWADKTSTCKPSDKQSCQVSSDCFPARSGKHYTSSAHGNNIGGDCVKKASAGGCYNSNPTSCSGSYNGLGNRGASRNHYGSDIGSAACGANKGKIQVYAPADGTIVWTGVSSGGGRTMVIEHNKKCSGGGKFKTIFRHLAAYIKTSGSVKKDEPVGIEGGSNCYDKKAGEACLCDNKEQSVGKIYSGCNKVNAYAIHLHMETVNSGFSGSNYIGGEIENIMKSYCGGIQSLCGSCPVDTSNCVGKNDSSYDGTSANLDGIEGGIEGSMGGSTYSSDSCNYQSYLDSQNCTFCELFKQIFNVASIMTKIANEKLTGPTKALVNIGFLIWMCLYLLRHVTSYAKTSTGEMLKGILFQGFRVAVVIIALSGAIYEIMDLTINPIMETGLSFGRTLNQNSTCDDSAVYMQGIIGYDETTGYPKPNDSSSEKIGGLSKHLGESIICNLKNLEDSTGFLMSLGKYSICIGWERYPLWNVFASLGYLSTGIALWLVGMLLLLSFPWCLVDCVLQLCVAVALLPCAVGAYAFKITAQYLKIIWNMFMNSMFNFVFMAIIIYIINTNLGDWIGYTPGTNPDEKIFVTALNNGLAWWGIGFLKILMVCLFCWTFFDEAKTMADEFAKGISFHNLGQKVGGTVSSAVWNKGIEPGAAMAGKAIGATGRKIGREFNNSIGNEIHNTYNKYSYEFMKKFGQETENEDGTTSASLTFNIMGLKHKRTITNNDGTYTLQKETLSRSNYEKYFKQTTDKDGNTQVQARKSFMGMTMFGLFGKQDMVAHKDEATGRTIWETANKDVSRQRQLVTDENGDVVEFNKYSNLDDKNLFTQAMHYRSGKEHAPLVGVGTRSQKDNVMNVQELTDEKGNIVGRKMKFRNVTDNLIKQNGTTDINAMNHLINNASNKERAYEAIIISHMEQRNMNLNNKFQKREVIINKDKSVTIIQLNHNGSRQEINAKMLGNQMLIEEKTLDKNGNPIRYRKNNGIQTLTEVYNQQKDGTYTITSQQDFADYYKQKNGSTPPLNKDGEWGYHISRDKAMRGFTQQNFDDHIKQLDIEQKTRGDRHPQHTLSYEGISLADVQARMGIGSVQSAPRTSAETPRYQNTRQQSWQEQEHEIKRASEKPQTNWQEERERTHELYEKQEWEREKLEKLEREAMEKRERELREQQEHKEQQERELHEKQEREAQHQREQQEKEKQEAQEREIQQKSEAERIEADNKKAIQAEQREMYREQLRNLTKELKRAEEKIHLGQPEDIELYNKLKKQAEVLTKALADSEE